MMAILLQLLELVILAGLGMMAGAVIYTSYVELPVRQKLDAQGQLQNWQLVFPAASGFLKPFGIGLFPFFVIVGYVSGSWLWVLSTLLQIAVQPFTAMFISKTNNTLVAVGLVDATAATTNLIRKWDRLHRVRTALTSLSFTCALIAHFQTL